MVEKKIISGGVIKAASEDYIEGYLVRFTDPDDPDLHGEYFNKSTDFWIEKGYPVKGQPVLLEHGLDEAFKWIPVGVIEEITEDDIGLWINARLHDREYYEDMLQKLAQRGALQGVDKSALSRRAAIMAHAVRAYVGTGKVGWSSGALPQSVLHGEDGRHIASWAIIEGSITMTPAEPDGTEIQTVRKTFAELAKLIQLEYQHTPEEAIEPVADMVLVNESYTHKAQQERSIMDAQQILSMFREYIDELLAQLTGGSADEGAMAMEVSDGEKEEILAIVEEAIGEIAEDELKQMGEDEVGKMLVEKTYAYIQQKRERAAKLRKSFSNAAQINREQPAASKAGGNFSGGNMTGMPQVEVRSRFANWTDEDFSFAYQIAKSARGQFGAVERLFNDPKVIREFADKASKAYVAGQRKLGNDAVKALNWMKANEVMQSTLASYGDEWVPTLWNDAVWDKPRTDLVVPNAFDMIDMPSNPFEYPVVGADPTVYYVAESANKAQLSLDSTTSPFGESQVTTGKTTFTARKLGANVLISAELEEDSLAFTIPQLRQQAQDALLHSVDYVVFNGDTATTGNINSDGETITATNRSYQWGNGLIKQALVTASSNALDANAASPTLAHIRALRALLAPAAATNPRNLRLIMDVQSYLKLLNEGAVLTEDKYGRDATVITGQLGSIDGIPVFSSEDMYLADSDGKVTQTSNVVNRGRILLAHAPSWKVGYRRRPTQSMTFIPYYDVWSMVVSVRFDLAGRTEGASDDTVAILYNVGV